MDEVKWRYHLEQAKEAKDIYDTLRDLYPVKPLRVAMILGTRDRILGEKERRLLREFYTTELEWM